jgi:hypothetical protein
MVRDGLKHYLRIESKILALHIFSCILTTIALLRMGNVLEQLRPKNNCEPVRHSKLLTSYAPHQVAYGLEPVVFGLLADEWMKGACCGRSKSLT